MIDPELTRAIKTALKTASGQLGYVIDHVATDDNIENVLLQLKAVQATLSKATFDLLDDAYRKALAEKISFAYQNCPGDCGQEDRIEGLRKLFPEYTLEEIPEKIKEAGLVETSLRKILSEKNLDTPPSNV